MIRSRQYRDMFVNSFRDPPIVPRNPDLNFRMPMHDLENNAVVVSQDEARYLNTNYGSSHVLSCRA